MRKAALAVLAAGALILAAFASPAAADPAPQSCEGQFISTVVQGPNGPGRRSVADTFFGDDPHSVQIAEGVLQQACG